MAQFTYTFTEAERHAPVGSKITYSVTPEVLPKGATSFAVNAEVISSVTSDGENLRYYYPIQFYINNSKGERISDISSTTTFDWSTGQDNSSVNITGIKQPIVGSQGEASAPLVLVVMMSFTYADGAFTRKTIANLPITTPNVDDQLKPTFSIPTNIDPGDYMERGSGVPDGWPIYCGISVGAYTYPNMHVWFDGQWVDTYASSTLSAVTCELRYLDAAGNWVANSDHPMVSDGGIHWHCRSLPVPNPPTSDTRMRLVITAYDSADRSASAIFAALEPPKYIPPKLISCEADRCDESGNIDDEGAYVSAKVKYQLWTPPGVEEQYANTASESVLIVRGADASGSSTIDQVPNVGSDAVCVFGDGLLLPDKEYDVLYKISDQTPYPTVSYAIDHIDQTYNTIDCLAGGKGITFGGFATKEGFVNCMPSYFEGVVEFEKTATLHGPVKATKSDGSQWAWEWDRANGSLLVNSRMSLRNAAGSSDGFVWNAGNYAAYLRTDMHLESGVGFIKAQHTGNSWINGPNAAPIQATTAHADNNGSLWPLASVKSQNGKWCIGTLGNGLEIYYIADGQTDNSPKKRITFQPQAISQIGYASTIQVDGVPIWKFLYPVGAVYFSYSPTSPASLFGGTWAQLTGRFVRMANDVSTGGSDTHKHNSYDSTDAKGSLIGRYEQGGGKYAYYKYVSANAWTTNYHMSGSGTGSVSQSKSTGMEIQGHTAGASSLPPYQDLYAWRRTA